MNDRSGGPAPVQMSPQEVLQLALYALEEGNAEAVPALLREALEKFLLLARSVQIAALRGHLGRERSNTELLAVANDALEAGAEAMKDDPLYADDYRPVPGRDAGIVPTQYVNDGKGKPTADNEVNDD